MNEFFILTASKEQKTIILVIPITKNTDMNLRGRTFQKTDRRITNWMAKYGIKLLRMSIGLIFVWFGVLKFFPDISPAQDIATRTISLLSFGIIDSDTARILLAAWETIIGVGLISGRYLREVLLFLFLQMAGTITPIFLFPEEVFKSLPFVLTLEGQYIVKNLVLISAGIVIGATVRGGLLIPDPENIKKLNYQ